jgi:rubrerythrin
MDLFEFAKKMEKDGEKFYRNLAQTAVETGLKRILNMLADAEVRHYNALAEMEGFQEPGLKDSRILTDVKNVFSGMKLAAFDPNFAFPQIDIYRQALDIEEKSRKFYEQKAGEMKEEQPRSLFLKIAEEEKQHYFLVGNMIEFMQRPFRWLENAEWHHLEEY